MRVALISSGQENLGIEYLSACLKRRGHEVELFFDPQTFGGGMLFKVAWLKEKLDLKNVLVAKAVAWNPDIIGISCMSHSYRWSLDVARMIKQARPNLPIIFGGIHPTIVPETVIANDCVDLVAVGEAEESFCELLDCLGAGDLPASIKGIWFKKNQRITANPIYPPTNLELLPLPDKEIYYKKIPVFQRRYVTMASRGCPFACSYCCNTVIRRLYKDYKPRRVRSVSNLIEELLFAKKHYQVEFVHFHDEVFPFELEWITEFAELHAKFINLPFLIHTHFNLLQESHLKLLKKAGLFYIAFGLQSASEKIRKEVCHRHQSSESVKKVARLCKKYDINFSIDHIFGLPGETEAELKQAVELYRETAPNLVFSYWLTYFPKTPIIEIARQAGLLTAKEVAALEDGVGKTLHECGNFADKKNLLHYEFLFDLIPLVSETFHRKLESSPLLKLLPKNSYTHFFLTFLSGLKLKRPIFLERIKYLLCEKHVP
jgi:pyruvate-formate lyase-activating enzyme